MCGSVCLSSTDHRYDSGPATGATQRAGTDYRARFSVVIKHDGAAAILIGGQSAQHWDLDPRRPIPAERPGSRRASVGEGGGAKSCCHLFVARAVDRAVRRVWRRLAAGLERAVTAPWRNDSQAAVKQSSADGDVVWTDTISADDIQQMIDGPAGGRGSADAV